MWEVNWNFVGMAGRSLFRGINQLLQSLRELWPETSRPVGVDQADLQHVQQMHPILSRNDVKFIRTSGSAIT